MNEREIFDAALGISDSDERAAFLDGVCGDDVAQRSRLQELLDAQQRLGSFLDSPPPGMGATIDQPITEKPGTQIGPYKLLQQIGEGGMGVVYMAEQKEPVKRRVALKIIKPGMDTRQVIARFEAERQALAMMDHPNIAKVLDAGATESGRPYFVMELVNGISVTQYCDEQHLTPKERLELFVPICQAVQHAHQKGIIHRDLKPSNIMVALYDDRAVPKVIDFGVAKATSQSLTEKTMFTQLGQIMGTLEYMSPEQAQRNQLDIDTRSDVYSLGVLLYELLTGDTPFDRQRLRSAAFDEMLRIIREEEPPKPSTKVSGSEALPAIAANRKIEPAKLSILVRGELDWIVMKALEKDRGRRYSTATSFAEDIQHYLNDEAVVACPPSTRYRFKKFAKRNKAVIVTGFIVAGALLIGITGTTWQAMRATRAERAALVERDKADAARDQAEQRFDLAKDAVEQYLYRVTENEKLKHDSFHDLRKELLEAAVPFYEKLSDQKPADQEQHNAKGAALNRLGQLQQTLDDLTSSRENFAHALNTFEQLVSQFPDVPKYRRNVGYTHDRLAGVLDSLGDQAAARAHYEKSLVVSEQLAAKFPDVANHRYLLAGSHSNLASLLRRLGEHDASRAHFKIAIEMHESLVRQFPKDRKYQMDRATSVNNLGILLRDMGDLVAAREHLEKGLGIRERLVSQSPDTPEYRSRVASSHHALGNLLQDLGDREAARKHYENALEMREHLVSQFPDVPQYRAEVGYIHNVLGIVLQQLGDPDAARPNFEQAIEILEQVADPLPARRAFLATAHYNLALFLKTLGDPEAALIHNQAAIELREELVSNYPHVPRYREQLAESHNILASILQDQGKLEEAIASYKNAIELDSDSLIAHHNLGLALKAQGKLAEAIACEKKAAELDPDNAHRHTNLAWTLATTADLEVRNAAEAVKYAKKSIQLEPDRANHWSNLGVAHYRNGDWQDAVNALEKAGSQAKSGDFYHRFFLAMAYSKLQEEDKARLCYREALGYWYEKKRGSKQLQRFRDEAEELLGVAAKDRADLLVEHYSEVIQRDPKNWKALRARGDLFRDAKQWEEAIADYTAAIEGDPEDAYVFNARSISHCNLKDFEAALQDSNKAIELDPKSWMYSHRAWPLTELSRCEEAIADCNRALELDSNNATAMLRRGLARQKLSEFQAAVTDTVAALKLQPLSSWAWTRLRSCSLKVQDPDHLAALDELHQHLQNDAKSQASHEESLAEIYLIRAKLYVSKGDEQRAVADGEVASRLLGDASEPFEQLGQTFFDRGEWEETTQAYKRALDLGSEDPLTIQRVATGLIAMGDHEAYRDHCRAMLDRYGATDDAAVAGAVAQCFSYAPWPKPVLEKPLLLARLGAENPRCPVWDQHRYGLLLYRAEAYEEARQQLTGVLSRQADQPHGNLLFVLAMTQHALGNDERADELLMRGEKWLAENNHRTTLIAKQLGSEAKQLLSAESEAIANKQANKTTD